MTPHLLITVIFPFVFGVMALFFFVIGLRGIVSKKPFVISARWLFIVVLLGFSPAMFQFAWFPKPSGGPAILVAIRWLIPVMFIVIIIFLYFTLRGYTAFAVTDTSFREGLLASLEKLNLPHEETLATIKLPTIGADLQVAVQSWIGTGQLKAKQREFSTVLRDIVKGMNEYYQSGVVTKVNLTCCIFYVVIGVLLGVFGGVFFFAFGTTN
ncbi:MAG TPA: hypothetical protein VMC85_17560 [Desulfomonilaceae bacterium]|nr:hypothetical protein [Desulfomonilaceae bacterium]